MRLRPGPDKPSPGVATAEQVMQCKCGVKVIVVKRDETIGS
jgi:hypothetical protein